MSKENPPETKVNEDLTQRLNSSYIPKEFLLFENPEAKYVMINCKGKDGELIDVMATLDVLIQTLNELKKN